MLLSEIKTKFGINTIPFNYAINEDGSENTEWLTAWVSCTNKEDESAVRRRFLMRKESYDLVVKNPTTNLVVSLTIKTAASGEDYENVLIFAQEVQFPL